MLPRRNRKTSVVTASLELQRRYKETLLTPARVAMDSMLMPWYPRATNSSSAALARARSTESLMGRPLGRPPRVCRSLLLALRFAKVSNGFCARGEVRRFFCDFIALLSAGPTPPGMSAAIGAIRRPGQVSRFASAKRQNGAGYLRLEVLKA